MANNQKDFLRIQNNIHSQASVLQTSPAPSFQTYQTSKQLPLSLILLITSYLDNVADIARVTRASRLLYYLNLPRLYEHVSLHSYTQIRYFNGRPEGLGAGSPFAMALDGLVSRTVAPYVKTFELLGEFKEREQEEFEKGRIPDNTMMLNIVVRAAIDKMDKLQTFRWELDSNPMKTVYQGLSTRTTLTSLIIRYPSSRIPRPTVTIPGIPSLRSLHLIGLDPLCYNDDPSLLILLAKKLETLKMEWSPRMRTEREPSVYLQSFFGRCLSAKWKVPVKDFGMKNLYCRKDANMDSALDPRTVESVTVINCIDPQDPMTVFADSTWINRGDEAQIFKRLRKIRMDRLDEQQAKPMGLMEGLEEIYFINRNPPQISNGSSNETQSALTPVTAETSQVMVEIGAEFLAAISSQHGGSLKKLLLSDRWSLSSDALKGLLEKCPKLEQLGVAVHNGFDMLEHLMENAPQLKALRVLLRPEGALWNSLQDRDDEAHCIGIGAKTVGKECDNLKWFGIGDKYFELGDVVDVRDRASGGSRRLRIVTPVSWQKIKNVEVWGQDTLVL